MKIIMSYTFIFYIYVLIFLMLYVRWIVSANVMEYNEKYITDIYYKCEEYFWIIGGKYFLMMLRSCCYELAIYK